MENAAAARRQFEQYAGGLLSNADVQRMDRYIQHGTTTTLTHSLAVAWYSYRLYVVLGLSGQEKELIRGALLHDFYLYDWHEPNHGRLHGFYHPGIAAHNAEAHFAIDELEKDIIKKHMWPLTLVPPRHRVAAIVCMVDKACSTAEVLRIPYNRFLRIMIQHYLKKDSSD